MTDEGFCYADYVRRRCGVVEKVTRLNEQHRIDTDTVLKVSAERDAAEDRAVAAETEAKQLRAERQAVAESWKAVAEEKKRLWGVVGHLPNCWRLYEIPTRSYLEQRKANGLGICAGQALVMLDRIDQLEAALKLNICPECEAIDEEDAWGL